ncbi:SDR16C5.2 family protein [Megaselia abdita]
MSPNPNNGPLKNINNNNIESKVEDIRSSTPTAKETTLEWLVGTLWSIVDFFVFIIQSIGYILEDLYYIAFGYPEKDLLNEIALITGGGNGLGRQLAERLARLGCKIVIWDINQEGIRQTVKLVEAEGGKCKGYVVDISKKEEVYKAAEIVKKEVGDVTLLVNNAGVVSGLPLLDTPDYLIERSFNVNVLSHFWTTKAFLPHMIEKDHGHIVTIASLAGHVGISKLVDYCSSKFAAVGFDEALRLELDVLGHHGVFTTCICPFFIQSTGMFDDVNARWVPTLDPNVVADKVIKAIKEKEKCAILPGYLKAILPLKFIFPWGCTGGLLRRLVPDANPHGNISCPQTVIPEPEKKISSTKTDILANLSDSLPKTASLLIQRTSSSMGERVL